MSRRRWVPAPLLAVLAAALPLALLAALAVADPPVFEEILEPAVDAAPLNPGDVHMVASFSDPDSEHECSDWQIRTASSAELVWTAQCAMGQEKVHIHLGDGEFVGSHAGRTSLLHNAEYELRVRFHGEEGEEGEWESRRFSTMPAGPQGKDTAKPWVARPGYAVEVFAGGLQLPVNIAMVPNPGPHGGDPLLYVTELYGNVKVVTRDGSVKDYATGLLNFDPTGKFPGSGVQGVAGVVVDPASGDLFVSLVYADETEGLEPPVPHYPKVIRLHSDERGLSAVGSPTTVLDMAPEPQGASHQVSNLTISPDGKLFVHNGDGGHPESAHELDSFRGKVLRMELNGDPVAGNPFYTDDGEDTARDYVFARGFRNAFGGAWRLADGTHYAVENGPDIDRLARIVEGEDYGWPADETMSHRAAYRWSPPHAPVNIEFVEPQRFGGSGFPPQAMGHAFVTESGATYVSGPQVNGKRIVEFALAPDGSLRSGPTTLAEYEGTGKATAVGLAAGADGLYFTDLYKDQDYGSPIDRGANLLRVVYCGASCPGEEAAAPGPSPVADVVPPGVRRFRTQRKTFAVGLERRGARTAATRRGTVFRYTLSERAAVRIRIRPLVRGWRIGKGRCQLLPKRARQRLGERRPLRRCILPSGRGVRVRGGCHPASWRHGRGQRLRARCVVRGPHGVLKASGRPGPNHRPFAGRLGVRKLRPGRYLATIRARDRAGNLSMPRHAPFRIVARRYGPARAE